MSAGTSGAGAAVYERIAVIGLGLLGGSVAHAACSRRAGTRVVGVSRRAEGARRAQELGVVDEAVTDLAAGVRGADLVVVATTLEATPAVIREASPYLASGVHVTDVGSVKGELAEIVPGLLPPGAVFVGAHPMAGSHHRGIDHARPDLFDGAACVLTPTSTTPGAAVARVRRFWEALGARVEERDPGRHDLEVAWVSHLPHAIAFAFAGRLADAPAQIGAVQGAGFRDFTRIAWGDPELWAEILNANRKALVGPLRDVAGSLEKLARLVESGDGEALERFIAEARESLARHAGPSRKPGGNEDLQVARTATGARSDVDHS